VGEVKGKPCFLKKRSKRLFLLSGFAAVLLGCFHTAKAASYVTQGQCGGFPGVALNSPPEFCVGLVADHLGFTRGVAVQGDTIYVLDMGGWHKGHGRLLRLRHGGRATPEVLLSGLDEPSALIAAPGGALYMGVLGRILRVTPTDTGAKLQDVLTGLPATGRHPLPALALAPDGGLYINVGSGSDHCESPAGKVPDPKATCPERASTPQRAAIVHIKPGSAAISWAQAEPVAYGLRNSMALAVLPGGALVDAVNERDAINAADPALKDAKLPNDFYGVVRKGADYGWPYCFDATRANPEYSGHDCSQFTAPTLLLPPHAAPLGMLRYSGKALPALDGKLLITYHGYRTTGHRVVSLAVSPAGQPEGQPTDLIWGWTSDPAHPQGAPVSLAQEDDGSLLITEDHNGTLLRLTKK
jgi:glucose/arabinose dehydrogenase